MPKFTADARHFSLPARLPARFPSKSRHFSSSFCRFIRRRAPLHLPGRVGLPAPPPICLPLLHPSVPPSRSRISRIDGGGSRPSGAGSTPSTVVAPLRPATLCWIASRELPLICFDLHSGQGYWTNMVEGNDDLPLDDFSSPPEEQQSPVIKSTPSARPN
ncbi:hypothetical protein C2845_PM11G29890 [Panicum miliaceum]|uniref:Uncharacterized protein n=1 Tax=Panicum miliaceum TaxID=4540 RepID=A0A3L6RTF4_PANMI|nr:hypothetical protein C2845_PM11G29890 [Panicum miliaceum]